MRVVIKLIEQQPIKEQRRLQQLLLRPIGQKGYASSQAVRRNDAHLNGKTQHLAREYELNLPG